ncbi:hypothetical protein L227DRAFT_580665 [Lentinus tigrinus ALCF2SS1-6]|uniref:Protein kinase domain-containing protein n=2 Tax=Lentinus tigrinus TaxID=5365 RepID=A0A5C2RU81_9APHY|nr:hypothetical protein L227DRAFT_580665 [Lentinus tigrinus ALCF2SS1-6]
MLAIYITSIVPSQVPGGLSEADAPFDCTLYSKHVHHLDLLGTAAASPLKLYFMNRLKFERDDIAIHSAKLLFNTDPPPPGRSQDRRFLPLVICKLTCDPEAFPDLQHEAEIFALQLAKLQGNDVPRCFGYFSGRCTGDGQQPEIGMLLLESVGPQLQRPLGVLPTDFCVKVLTALKRIHQEGVEMHTFSGDDVFVKNADTDNASPCIYNFQAAFSHHRCELNFPIEKGHFRPTRLGAGCDELFWACDTAELWLPTPRIFKVFLRGNADAVDSADALVKLYYFNLKDGNKQYRELDEKVRSEAERAWEALKWWRIQREERDAQPLELQDPPKEYW